MGLFNFNPNDAECFLVPRNGKPVKVHATDIQYSFEGPLCEPNVIIRGYADTRTNLTVVKEKVYMETKASGQKPSMAYRQVIFNPPATIVLWEDGTKTVVHCDERDEFDPKYGLALCFMKKALGNTSRELNKVLHKELKED